MSVLLPEVQKIVEEHEWEDLPSYPISAHRRDLEMTALRVSELVLKKAVEIAERYEKRESQYVAARPELPLTAKNDFVERSIAAFDIARELRKLSEETL